LPKRNPGKPVKKKGPLGEEWGISTTGISKDHMIGCFTEIIKESPSCIKSQDLINQLSAVERSRSGNISSDTFSDLFMASCFCAYARKMKATEIMPLINMGSVEFNKRRFDTFKSFINLNLSLDEKPKQDLLESNLVSTPQIEDEIEQLILDRENLKNKGNNVEQNIEEFFSPFL
jgi:hypothetical protein